MTDRIDALKKLKARVEADSGDYSFKDLRTAGFHNLSRLFLEAKANGSLDAARALHEAVLPEWAVNHIGEADGKIGPWFCCIVPRLGKGLEGGILESSANPARAWLLAILSALISQAEQSQ